MSAYACEPNRGSEPEVGWQWALQMARFHEVVVLTRANNRGPIEKALPPGSEGAPRFIYHDLSPTLLRLKKILPLPIWYYLAWQFSARRIIQALVRNEPFDLIHHVTYAAVRYPTAIAGHGVPSLWGPVGGIENLPWRMLTPRYPGEWIGEAARNLANTFQTSRFSTLACRARQCQHVVASTLEMQTAMGRLGVSSALLPTIGIRPEPVTRLAGAGKSGPLQLLFVGNLLFWKGVDLALHALAASGTDAIFTLIGSGPFQKQAQALAERLGVSGRVDFRGQQPREKVLEAYRQFDVMLYPSLHDSGAFVVLEAMSCGLPVICLDRGGPALAVKPGCGWKINPSTRAQTIADLARAIQAADRNRERLRAMGEAARESVTREYGWDAKGEAMNKIYGAVVGDHPSQSIPR